MAKRRKIRPWCPECGSMMLPYNPGNVDHVLATAPAREWNCIVSSPDLLLLACIAVEARDGRALAAALQLAGMRLRVRGS